MKLRIRCAAKRAATLPQACSSTPRPRRVSDLEVVRATLGTLFHGELPTVGVNDAKYFEPVEAGKELIPFEIPKADILPISSALFRSGEPGAMNLALRFPHMRTAPSK
jgi:hypothetical protein